MLETALAESGLDSHDTRRAQIDGALAGVCQSLGQTNRAEHLYQESVEILERTFPEGHPVLLECAYPLTAKARRCPTARW